jgi:hypothetical protein
MNSVRVLLVLLSLVLFVSSQLPADDSYDYRNPLQHFNSHENIKQIRITKRDYRFEEDFDVDSDFGHLGSIVQSSFSLRKNYSFYDHEGNAIFYAYGRVFSLGSLITSATVLDVYDHMGQNLVGSFEGALLTLYPSKFYFYDFSGICIGIAYMDNDKCSFVIYHPTHSQKILAIYTRVFVENVQDWWQIDIVEPGAIDWRLLISFGAFAVDTQAEYRADD